MHFVHAFIRYVIIIYFIKWNGYNFHILKRQCFKDDENIKERNVRKCKKNNCSNMYHSIVYIKNKRGVRGEEQKKKKIINNKYLFLLNNFIDINKDKTYLSTSLKRKYFKNQKNDVHNICKNKIKDYKTINLYMNKIEEESKEEKQNEEDILNKDNINNKPIYNNNNNDIFYDKFNTKQYEKIIKKKNIHSILLCGGIGKRTELIGPKQFLKLNDIPLFIYSFNLFIKCNIIKSLTLVCDKKHFASIIQSINVYNKLLLKRKIINSFLKNVNDKLNINMKEYHENEEDNIKEFNSQKINIEDSHFNDASNITDYINKNTYIIYDNEKNKCILDMKELLNDLSKGIRIRKKHEKNEKHIIRIKPKHININRYKLLKIVESGKERLDSFLNAMKSIDIELNSQTYIYELLKQYNEEKNEKNDNILYEFENININNCNKNHNSNNDNIENNNIKKKKKKKINVTNILIHDGARPFLSEFDFFNLIYYSTVDKNVILGSKATDTIKLIQHEEENKKKTTSHFIKKTIDRDTIFQAQTPQIFDSKTLHNNILEYIIPNKNNEKNIKQKININIINDNNNNNNHSNSEEQNSKQFTDTSSLYEYFNKSKKKKKIFVLQSNFPNFKVTTPEDVLHSFFLMKYIYNYKFIDIEQSIFKDEYINSHSTYILKKQFNNFFFYDALNEKQKILYHKFYYISK
ncbi:2-C-methyl-D-erythritol 4-phosphate cytidylyltransferase, putative [Plasmodium gaboni]|uniref:2-C-methyl-D-erythritol 4-phosphate cytidylyltransferase, putative n=1 Tax=Plasmodium gaboni TaxID=647221 RepID=A0ABY1UGF7_9APIC|nr:2-C-methyl-D-erythritol 4-phosphate cytidylyltransferase, putative [Plasmodium gaboni]